jgi:hypothetical protein
MQLPWPNPMYHLAVSLNTSQEDCAEDAHANLNFLYSIHYLTNDQCRRKLVSNTRTANGAISARA